MRSDKTDHLTFSLIPSRCNLPVLLVMHLAVVGSAALGLSKTVLNEAERLGVRLAVEAHTCRQVLVTNDGGNAMALARAVWRRTEDEVVSLVSRRLLEVDGVTAALVQAARVGTADGSATVLRAVVVIVKGGIDDGVARRQCRSSCCGGGDAEGNGEDGGVMHLDESIE